MNAADRVIRWSTAPAVFAANRVPSVRAIRAALHVGQPRAQRLREYLAAATDTHGRNLAA
jgi:hypothetical protein